MGTPKRPSNRPMLPLPPIHQTALPPVVGEPEPEVEIVDIEEVDLSRKEAIAHIILMTSAERVLLRFGLRPDVDAQALKVEMHLRLPKRSERKEFDQIAANCRDKKDLIHLVAITLQRVAKQRTDDNRIKQEQLSKKR